MARPGGAPAAGSACGVVTALAAALAAMAAPTTDGRAAAQALCTRALALAEDDLRAVRELLHGSPAERAVEVPLAIAGAAAQVAALAAEVAENVGPQLRGDAAVAAALAEAGARGAAELVAVNLAAGEEDARLAYARELADAAAESARRALARVG